MVLFLRVQYSGLLVAFWLAITASLSADGAQIYISCSPSSFNDIVRIKIDVYHLITRRVSFSLLNHGKTNALLVGSPPTPVARCRGFSLTPNLDGSSFHTLNATRVSELFSAVFFFKDQSMGKSSMPFIRNHSYLHSHFSRPASNCYPQIFYFSS